MSPPKTYILIACLKLFTNNNNNNNNNKFYFYSAFQNQPKLFKFSSLPPFVAGHWNKTVEISPCLCHNCLTPVEEQSSDWPNAVEKFKLSLGNQPVVMLGKAVCKCHSVSVMKNINSWIVSADLSFYPFIVSCVQPPTRVVLFDFLVVFCRWWIWVYVCFYFLVTL